MSQTNSVMPTTTEERKQSDAHDSQLAVQEAPKELDALHTLQGDTTIADQVVQKLAGIAAREIPGVYAMGGAARRAISNLAQRIPGGAVGSDVTGGVSIQKGERETAIVVSVVIEYGAAIVDVADQIRDNVIRAVEHGTGLAVVSVDVNVTDVHLPDEEGDDQGAAQGGDQLR